MLAFLVFLIILSVLVLAHEFGHFLAARLLGVKADEFGYGFPPRLLGFVKADGRWKRVAARDFRPYHNTIWSLNWLPLGGFVRLKGEDAGEAEHAKDSFAAKKAWQRFVIIVAGVVMNWLLAALIFTSGFLVGVPTQTDQLPPSAHISDVKVQISDVVKNSPAQASGLQPGDYLLSVRGSDVRTAEQAKDALGAASKDLRAFPITVERQGKATGASVTPAYLETLKRPGVGLALINTGTVRFPPHLAAWYGVKTTWAYTRAIFSGLGGIIKGLVVEQRVSADVSGPVGIAVLTRRFVNHGPWVLLQFTALLSLNLAAINVFPIPALDGGRLAFIIIEWVRRKKLNARWEANLHKAGFALLMALILLVTVKDIHAYGGALWGGLQRLIGL